MIFYHIQLFIYHTVFQRRTLSAKGLRNTYSRIGQGALSKMKQSLRPAMHFLSVRFNTFYWFHKIRLFLMNPVYPHHPGVLQTSILSSELVFLKTANRFDPMRPLSIIPWLFTLAGRVAQLAISFLCTMGMPFIDSNWKALYCCLAVIFNNQLIISRSSRNLFPGGIRTHDLIVPSQGSRSLGNCTSSSHHSEHILLSK